MGRIGSRLIRAVTISVVGLLVTAMAYAGIVGVFQGRIVRPKGLEREESVLYVRSRNGMARKVKVEKAVVVEYDEDVPAGERRKEPRQSLCDDTLVRVTAEQSDKEDGEWKAINILILPEPEPPSGTAARMQWASFFESQASRPETPDAAQESGSAKAKTKPEDSEKASKADGKADRGGDRSTERKKEGAGEQDRSGSDEPKNQRKNGTNGFCQP